MANLKSVKRRSLALADQIVGLPGAQRDANIENPVMITFAVKELKSEPMTTKKLASDLRPIRRIIVAVDLAKTCEATVSYAAKLAKRCNAALYITYVFWPCMISEGDPYHLADQVQREFRKKLNNLADQVRGIVPRCKSPFLVGEPAERIATLARDVRADLIVTTDYDPTFGTRPFKVDKAVKIVLQAPCSVLVYHEGKKM